MASTRSGPEGRAERNEGGLDPNNGSTASTNRTALIDLDFVRELIAVVDASGVDTLEISRGGTRVRISKSPIPSAVVPASASPAVPVPPSANPPAAPPDCLVEHVVVQE